ncbi:response regulator [Candidatus Gracilibacteria bacterium]|nr:response regulator [Candidatus Gracilibacteria bacterium]
MVKKPKILVVDDERALSTALRLKLTNSGFDVKTAFDGEEALRILEKESFDLILLDLIMPNMDGFQVLKVFVEQKMSGKVIVTSNLSQEEDEEKAKALGAIRYFVKSDTPLLKIVEYVKEAIGTKKGKKVK